MNLSFKKNMKVDKLRHLGYNNMYSQPCMKRSHLRQRKKWPYKTIDLLKFSILGQENGGLLVEVAA